MMKELIDKAQKTSNLTFNEIITLLDNNEFDNEIYKAANFVRQKHIGNDIHLRGLIEFSNICAQNCLYCGLRRDNKKITRYRLSENEIFNYAKKAKDYGFQTIVLQSGEDAYFSNDKLVPIIKKIKELDVAITLSSGEKTFAEYEEIKKAGADRYLIRIETSDQELYKKMHPNMSFANRIKCLEYLKELDFEVGTGCLVGLPQQTTESLANDILFFKSIDADMLGIGPFIPNPDTPLKDVSSDNFNLALKVMALTRLLLPDINLPATTAMETIQKNGRNLALQAGANVVMPNVTDEEYRKLYELYPGKTHSPQGFLNCYEEIKTKIESIGRTISTNKGFRKRTN